MLSAHDRQGPTREHVPERRDPVPAAPGRLPAGLSNAAVARYVARMAVVPTEVDAVAAALDSVLGQGHDPGGLRAALIAAVANLGALQAVSAQLVNAIP